MEANKPIISQKEYLKKYLSKDKGDKKKKKKKVKITSSSLIKRSVIIDDNLGLPDVASIDDEEFNLGHLGDEAPQIAGIVDERPPEVIAREVHGDRTKWKPVGESDDENYIKQLVGQLSAKSDSLKNNDENGERQGRIKSSMMRDNDFDASPPRNRDKVSNKLKRKSFDKDSSDSDVSVVRSKSQKSKGKSRDKYDSDSDSSPPRKQNRKGEKNIRGTTRDSSPQRKNDNSYLNKGSVRNGKQRDSDSDASPPRSKNHSHKNKGERSSYKGRDSDSDSMPRKDNKYQNRDSKSSFRGRQNVSPGPSSSKNREKESLSNARSRRDSDSDMSPPRKKDKRREHKRKNSSDSDLSPPRKDDNGSLKRADRNRFDKEQASRHKYSDKSLHLRRKDSDSDMSPPRLKSKNSRELKKSRDSDSDLSPPRQNKKKSNFSKDGSDSDLSPPRKSKDVLSKRKNEKSIKLDKTLDGKKAGLQSAKGLKDELKHLREKEDAAFSKMKASVSGQNAAVVMRDRKTGRIRDLEKEKEVQREKSAKALERENKYAKWGRGLKQIEEAEERLASTLHEMNKPLARYAGDDDLERMLKAQEREGDPMLDYIKSKQSESVSVDNIGKQKYQGHFMPNRFGLRPGHRWDGVDRSNGYERQWFEKQNARKAVQEEAYKWSTSDM